MASLVKTFRTHARRLISTLPSSTVQNKYHTSIPQRCTALWDPPYINQKPDIPEYQTLNIRIRGYDFTTVESFLKYVHNFTFGLGLNATAFPVPARTSTLKTYQPNSTKVADEIHLAHYERTVQLSDVPTTKLPIVIDVLQCNQPEGVEFTIKEHDADEDEFRYVPDNMLIDLQSQLQEMDDLREARKKK